VRISPFLPANERRLQPRLTEPLKEGFVLTYNEKGRREMLLACLAH